MLNDHEYQTLRKYRHGAFLNEEDRPTMEYLARMGFAHIGFSTESGSAVFTASPAPRGCLWLHEERVNRSPVLRTLRVAAEMFLC